ncbi:MAG: SpoIIE family protein phosphatase [Alphaproteobacteria bacterium]|nr:SpoIIE family protein phosphatase [Alphaproteobacteria bacterium]
MIADVADGGEVQGHLGLIAAMTREFTATRDADVMAKTGLERITKYVGAEAASLFLIDDNGKELVCSACSGPVDITGLRIPADAGIVGRVYNGRSGQMVRDVTKDADFGAMVDEQTGFTTKSILCAPLSLGDDCLGCIEIINKNTGDGLFETDDLTLLETLAGAATLAIHNFRLTQQVVTQERERHELELAAQIQRQLLPPDGGAEFRVHGINMAARSVSGDFYDILPLADGRIWFNVGDVSGKGMNAALLMAKTSSLFRCLAKATENPGRLFDAINSELCETGTHGLFVTMAGGLFDPTTGKILMANAGHEPPLLLDGFGEQFTFFEAEAPPLGIMPGIAGPDGYPTHEIDLNGGTFYIFTDGLTEATTFGGGMLGIDGARALIREHAEESPDRQLNSITGAVRLPGQSLRDDLTMLVIKDMGVHEEPGSTVPVPDSKDSVSGQILRLRVPAKADRLKVIRAGTEQAASFCDADESWTTDLVMAVDEACQNVIRHAYSGWDEPGDIVVDFIRDTDRLIVHLMDFAEPVDQAKIKSRDLDEVRPGGLGVHLIKSVTDEAIFVDPPEGVGNLFKLTKRL